MSNEELTPTMTIKGLTDQQKSLLLAKVMGWEVGALGDVHWITVDGSELGDAERGRRVMSANLYDPATMALAWRVLNWAYDKNIVSMFGFIQKGIRLGAMLPADAQRAWLDLILTRIIEAGLIEVKI